MTTADHPLDDLALYALDALDDAEARAVEAHLADCPTCRDELDAHRATLGVLSPDESPPPSVWAGIARGIGAGDTPAPLPVAPPPPGPRPPLASVPPPGPDRAGAGGGARTPGETPAGPTHLRAGRGRGRPSGPRRWVAAVAAVAAAAVLAVGAIALLRPSDEGGDLDDLAQAALEAPGAEVITLTSDDGDQAARLVVDGSTGYLLIDDLATLPAGQEYQLWKLGGPAAVSLGMVGDGDASVAAVGVPDDTAQLALSVEPATGSVAPTGAIVATGSAPA